jgi:putative DNA primase/helicase
MSEARVDLTPSAAGLGEERLSDLGNARRFARLLGRDVRYIPAWGQWLVWDETHWRRDELAAVERYAQHIVESIHLDAATETDHDRRKALAKHALASDSARAIRGMLALAQSQFGIALPPDALDRDPWLLNCQNGTLELRTGTCRPHRREDLLTRCVPVAFDPAAACPTFETFLQRIFAGRPGLIAFVQRAAGYALTGDTREQCFFVLHGNGANGKSTLVGALMGLFDAYAAQVAAETLLARRSDVALILNDLATLEGKRLVAAVESDMGRRLAEALVKQLTGGDRLKVRRLYADAYEIQPTFKLWVSTNHKPTILGTDIAIWRRVRLVPFDVTIPVGEQNNRLPEKLEAERAGILAWAVRGCLAWQREGLGVPDEVRVATADYQAEMDTLGTFVGERCILDAQARTPIGDLYADYTEWAKEAGELPLTKRNFGDRLAEKGFPADREGKGKRRTRIRLGLRLRTSMDGDSETLSTDACPDARTQTDADSGNFLHDDSSRESLQKPRPSPSVASVDTPPDWVTESTE